MIADAVHSLGDLGSDAVTLYAHKISSKGPSPSYPYGYGRVRTSIEAHTRLNNELFDFVGRLLTLNLWSFSAVL
jgi:hypothetical protein